jgi:hypothetical protein
MTEDLNVAYDIWQELKQYIIAADRPDAAHNLLGVLIDHDCEVEQIKEVFDQDATMRRALADHLDNWSDAESEEEIDDDEY